MAKLFDEARQHGLAGGVTYSDVSGNGGSSLLSLTNSRDKPANRRQVDAQLGRGFMLMTYAHAAMNRIHACGALAWPAVALTVRERDCLLWVSTGKTSWEIARILSISERTVVFHVTNAAKKLGTTTRAQAVAKAVSMRLITP